MDEPRQHVPVEVLAGRDQGKPDVAVGFEDLQDAGRADRLRPGSDQIRDVHGRLGHPTTRRCGSTSFVTTPPAATTAHPPIVTPGRIVALAPIEAPRRT